MAALSRPDSRHQGLDAEDVERSPQIVDERRQAELGPDVVESLHQKCALVHPLLDRAEGMFDGLAAPVEDFRPRPQAGGHAVEHRLVLQTRDLTIAVGAARPYRTTLAGRPVGVVYLLQIPELAFIARRKNLPGRTNEYVPLRIVAELVLAKEAVAHRRSALRLGNIRRYPRLLAGLDVLDREVAPIGGDIDGLDIEDGAGRLGGLGQQAKVDDLIGHGLLDDHFC